MANIKSKNTAIRQVNLDSENLQKGLAKLVLVIVELLRQVLERQATRRISSGTLTKQEIERLGLAFMQFKQTISEMSEHFGFSPNELDINLGRSIKLADGTVKPLDTAGKTTLVDLVDHILSKGVVLGGQVRISVADIDLVMLDLLGALSAARGIKKPRRRAQ